MRTKKSNAIAELIEHWNAVSRTGLPSFIAPPLTHT